MKRGNMWRLINLIHRLLFATQKKLTKNEGEMSREHEAKLIASGITINKAFYFVGKKRIEVILNDSDPNFVLLDRYSQVGYNVVLYKVKRYRDGKETSQPEGQLSGYTVEALFGRAKEMYNKSRG